MKVLVACEESQVVCEAFRERGHEAYSCDVVDPSGDHPEWHIKGEVLPLINGDCTFTTLDGESHTVCGEWDMIIAFPPCTYLTNAGAVRLLRSDRDGDFQMVNVDRLKKGIKARDFFMEFRYAKCKRVAIENPVPSGIFCMPPPTQSIQPYQFGHPFSKKTYLWLRGLPPLIPTEIVECKGSWVSGGSRRNGAPRSNQGEKFRDSYTRSKTFQGIADAMAEQWGKCKE